MLLAIKLLFIMKYFRWVTLQTKLLPSKYDLFFSGSRFLFARRTTNTPNTSNILLTRCQIATVAFEKYGQQVQAWQK